ncbi:molybdate transporter 1 [Abeliophyllum distichum]|uniref:Molybdate transporter 1 n=1 Tax=Abeliophyllum distichum TaxID=126358 RepID=A0ABD1QJ79_9LAMI
MMFQQRSVFGIMNLIGCWFGAMSCCHGAGGLAGSLVKILDQFPVGVLGVFLLFDGIELAMCSRDMNSKEESRCYAYLNSCFTLLAQVQHLDFFLGFLLLRARRLGDCSNLVPQLSEIICRSNIELELSQCWSVNMDDLFDEFL